MSYATSQLATPHPYEVRFIQMSYVTHRATPSPMSYAIPNELRHTLIFYHTPMSYATLHGLCHTPINHTTTQELRQTSMSYATPR